MIIIMVIITVIIIMMMVNSCSIIIMMIIMINGNDKHYHFYIFVITLIIIIITIICTFVIIIVVISLPPSHLPPSLPHRLLHLRDSAFPNITPSPHLSPRQNTASWHIFATSSREQIDASSPSSLEGVAVYLSRCLVESRVLYRVQFR